MSIESGPKHDLEIPEIPEIGKTYKGVVFRESQGEFKSKVKLRDNRGQNFLLQPKNGWRPLPGNLYEIRLTKLLVAPGPLESQKGYLGRWECEPVDIDRDEDSFGNK